MREDGDATSAPASLRLGPASPEGKGMNSSRQARRVTGGTRRLLWLAILFAVLLAAYATWPLWGLYRITAAIEARDAQALDHLVDYRELRRTLTGQIVESYFKIAGGGKPLGNLGQQLAASVGGAVADPIIEQFLNSKTLLSLLGTGHAPAANTAIGDMALARLSLSDVFGNPWQLFRNAEYSGQLFYATVPPGAPPDKQFRLRLRLINWQWRLAGVGLPEPVRAHIAREIQKLIQR